MIDWEEKARGWLDEHDYEAHPADLSELLREAYQAGADAAVDTAVDAMRAVHGELPSGCPVTETRSSWLLFKSLSPEEVCAYLESRGWRLVSENRIWRGYVPSGAPGKRAGQPGHVWVPLGPHYADYALCVARCLDSVAEAEQRPCRAALVAGTIVDRRDR